MRRSLKIKAIKKSKTSAGKSKGKKSKSKSKSKSTQRGGLTRNKVIHKIDEMNQYISEIESAEFRIIIASGSNPDLIFRGQVNTPHYGHPVVRLYGTGIKPKNKRRGRMGWVGGYRVTRNQNGRSKDHTHDWSSFSELDSLLNATPSYLLPRDKPLGWEPSKHEAWKKISSLVSSCMDTGKYAEEAGGRDGEPCSFKEFIHYNLSFPPPHTHVRTTFPPYPIRKKDLPGSYLKFYDLVKNNWRTVVAPFIIDVPNKEPVLFTGNHDHKLLFERVWLNTINDVVVGLNKFGNSLIKNEIEKSNIIGQGETGKLYKTLLSMPAFGHDTDATTGTHGEEFDPYSADILATHGAWGTEPPYTIHNPDE